MAMQQALIRKIWQKNNTTFSIEWSDGLTKDYRLSHLQRVCPCAGCRDESTRKKLIDDKLIKDDVRAVRIKSVGRYALRVTFTSGCSNGIYDFEMLKKM